MTYPPQPGPYGQQPGPYGGQPGGPQQGGPQQGGYPQPGGPPPGAPPQPGGPQPGGPGGFPPSGGFPQQGMQQGGYPPQGQPPGFPQGPDGFDQQPKSKKTGLIAGIAAAVLVIAAVLVTGFWAPGFFVSDDSETSAEGGNDSGGDAADNGDSGSGGDSGIGDQDGGAGDSGDTGSSGDTGDTGGTDSGGDSGSAGAETTAAEYASALSDLDVPRMTQLACAGATNAAPEGEAPKGLKIQASVTSVEQTSAGKATAKLDMQVSSGQQSGNMKADMTLEDQGGWCVSGFTPSGGGSTGF